MEIKLMKSKKHHLKLIAIAIILNSFIISSFAQQGYGSGSLFGTSFSGSTKPLRKFVSENGNGSAIAPVNWMILAANQDGSGFDMVREDRCMYAGHLAVGIQGGTATSSYYAPKVGTPERCIQTTLSEDGRCQVSFGKPIRDNFGQTILPFEKKDPSDPRPDKYKGIVIYHAISVPGDPYGYVVIAKIAQTMKNMWKSQGAEAIAVALSIRCYSQAHINNSSRIDENKVESTYNKELGMEDAYNPQTGETFWVSPSGSDWKENGPQGPGYYKWLGNELKKLSPGRGD
jgi:hypothetical protein